MLAYSGGLDTSVIIPWLKEHYDNCEVIAVCGNVGQDDELMDLNSEQWLPEPANFNVEDLTDEFVNEFVIPTTQAGADYEGYLLTSLARPILAKRVMEIAKAEGRMLFATAAPERATIRCDLSWPLCTLRRK